MKSAQRKWVCKNCGRRNKTVVVPGGTMKCEYCTEVNSVRTVPVPDGGVPGGPAATSGKLVDDTRKRGVVARLRERYDDARELVSLGEPYSAQPYAHLEWVLGTRRNLDRDEAAFDNGVSELVVLWLQDLAQELDGRALPPSASGFGEGATSDADSRQAVARGLRIATRDFAEAFLSPRLDSVGEP